MHKLTHLLHRESSRAILCSELEPWFLPPFALVASQAPHIKLSAFCIEPGASPSSCMPLPCAHTPFPGGLS
ncbi:hypothetical protein AMTR_s00008p00246280 [Amborella trichopoda]|uniref:Uncharacterized protein n=1 Tax=Amborella trichopoda TaxID=13333 RepID=W1NJL7_AMBTC|nr:hypothetical protein AMTR_s00008p00246280 [Amborella trichopoda]